MPEPIISEIQREIEDFPNKVVEIENNLSFNQANTLRQINYYANNKFESGDTDTEGFRKVFFNITDSVLGNDRKAIDVDTKDIRLIPEDGQSSFPAWLLSKELRLWMKENKFGKLLNDLVSDFPLWGTVVLKKTASDIPSLVNVKNLVLDPSADTLEDTFVDEILRFTPLQFARVGLEKGWSNVEETLAAYAGQEIQVVQRTGDWVGNQRHFWLVSGIDIEKGLVLAHDLIPHPYKESHWEKIVGRWLGLGDIEKLFENIIATNELANLKRKGLYWAALHIFQTRDESVAKNVLTDARNGDIFRVFSEITPIATEERNLAAYNQEEQRWDRNREERTFSFDVIRGERTPAGTPLGSAQLSFAQSAGFFDLKRENLGLFLKEVVTDWILPAFKSRKGAEHIVNLVGDEFELDKLRRLSFDAEVSQRVLQFIVDKNKVPSQDEIRTFRDIAATKNKKKNTFDVLVPESFYNNLKYKVDVVITNEQVDTAAIQTTLVTALQMIAANPNIVTVPHLRRTFAMLLNKSGINAEDILPPEEETFSPSSEALGETGGVIPATGTPPSVAPPAAPGRVLAETTV